MSHLYNHKKSHSTSTLSLSRSLNTLLEQKKGKAISFKAILSAVDDKSFGLLLMLFALPSALPVPAAGYSTPFGIILALLGFQMCRGRHYPWLPKRVLKYEFKSGFAQKMIHGIEWTGKKIEWLVKPRMESFCQKFGHAIMGILVILMAGLMILPIPLTNTAPAMVIFLIGMGLSEHDGLLLFFAFIISLLAISVYSFVLWLFFKYGIAGISQIKEWILSVL